MQKLNPRAVWVLFVSTVVTWLVIAMLFAVIIDSIVPLLTDDYALASGLIMWLLIATFVSPIFALIWANFSYNFYRYELRNDGFRKEFGVIWKQYTTVPYDRIQNVDIRRGVVDRILGLSSLNIQTAGSAGSEGVLPGLSHEVAEQLRDELISRARQARTTNQGL